MHGTLLQCWTNPCCPPCQPGCMPWRGAAEMWCITPHTLLLCSAPLRFGCTHCSQPLPQAAAVRMSPCRALPSPADCCVPAGHSAAACCVTAAATSQPLLSPHGCHLLLLSVSCEQQRQQQQAIVQTSQQRNSSSSSSSVRSSTRGEASMHKHCALHTSCCSWLCVDVCLTHAADPRQRWGAAAVG